MHRTSPPPLPRSYPARAGIDPKWWRSVLFYLFATVIQATLALATLGWLISDWKAQWGNETFVHAAYLSYGGMLIAAFGKWLLMATMLVYFGATTVLLATTVAVFRFSERGRYLKAFAYSSVVALPAGTLASIYAIRRLAPDSSKPGD